MTRSEQLTSRAYIPDGVINILAIWEALDEASRSLGAAENPLQELRQGVGTWELRDLAITLYPYVEQVWAALPERLNDGYIAYDWEMIPFIIQQIDWTTAQGSPITVELPPVDEMIGAIEYNWPER